MTEMGPCLAGDRYSGSDCSLSFPSLFSGSELSQLQPTFRLLGCEKSPLAGDYPPPLRRFVLQEPCIDNLLFCNRR